MTHLHVYQNENLLWIGETGGETACAVGYSPAPGSDEFEAAESLALNLERLARRLRMYAARKVLQKR